MPIERHFNFRKYEGSIDSNGWYAFHPVYTVAANSKKVTTVRAFIRLVKGNPTKKQYDQNWSTLEDIDAPISKEMYLDHETLSDDAIVQAWTEKQVGDGKSTRYPPSFHTAKNTDKSNRRNALQTAMIDLRDHIVKLVEKGYVYEKEEAEMVETYNLRKPHGQLYPMLAQNFKDKRDDLRYPAIIQPKLNGLRCLCHLYIPSGIKKEDCIMDEQKDVWENKPSLKKLENVSKSPPPIADSDSDSDSDSEEEISVRKMSGYRSADSDDSCCPNGTDSNIITYLNVQLYTRNSRNFEGLDRIKHCLLPILFSAYDWEKRESLYFDGELYIHGETLQYITSLARTGEAHDDKNKLEFWLFDAFYPSRTKEFVTKKSKCETFDVRYKRLSDLVIGDHHPSEIKEFEFIKRNMQHEADRLCKLIERDIKFDESLPESDREDGSVNLHGYESYQEALDMKKAVSSSSIQGVKVLKFDKLVIVPNVKVESAAQIHLNYFGYLSTKFEGAMVRNIDGCYIANLGSDGSRRSPDLLKYKPLHSGEYKVVGWTTGKGTNAGAVIWKCEVKLKGKKKVFNVVPKNSSLKERKTIAKSLKKKFEKDYEGRLYTVDYDELSEDGIPLRAKGVGFRDIE